MKQKLFFSIIILAVSAGFVSCRRDISFKLPHPPNLLVVEGRIEVDSVPYVILTTNSDYYGVTQTSDLGKIFVHDASVKVTDGEDTVTLQEFTFDSAGVKVGVYVNPFVNFKGVEGRTYQLLIKANGQQVSSVTTIPKAYPLDSVWVEENANSKKPDLVRLMCRYKDPPELGQYVRYFTKRNSEPFEPGVNSVFDDKIINGTTFNFPLDRGINRNDSSAYKNFGYFYKGDTITIKWCNIDQATFNFWRTLEVESESQGPFSSPIKVQGNIQGGLGVWAGYNPSYKSIIIPK